VLGSIGTVGDAYDNAMAESFVDTYKTELIADRVWRSQAQVELATVDWVAWFNTRRLHSSLGDVPPVEIEQQYAAAQQALSAPVALGRGPARRQALIPQLA
jgi:putative transposase